MDGFGDLWEENADDDTDMEGSEWGLTDGETMFSDGELSLEVAQLEEDARTSPYFSCDTPLIEWCRPRRDR
jgi:hypothetical protein